MTSGDNGAEKRATVRRFSGAESDRAPVDLTPDQIDERDLFAADRISALVEATPAHSQTIEQLGGR